MSLHSHEYIHLNNTTLALMSLIKGQFSVAVPPACTDWFLQSRRKAENHEGTHTDMRKHAIFFIRLLNRLPGSQNVNHILTIRASSCLQSKAKVLEF